VVIVAAMADTIKSDPLPEASETIHGIVEQVEKVIEGKRDAIELALVSLLSGGHLLIEDVPGVGKTMLAKALARSTSCTVNRIQFTPDLLPSDVLGVTIYDQNTGQFRFRPGAVFAHLVLGDEINRASPKTQSALLEAMEERQVTVDGATYPLAEPFMVIATQNPFEPEGIYALPQSQIDRFTMRIRIGYPARRAEMEILDVHGGDSALDQVSAVVTPDQMSALIRSTREIHVSDEVKRYIVEICDATRRHPAVQLGASPRAALFLLRTARAKAMREGREFVLPDDVKSLVPVVLAHRMILTPDAEVRGTSPDEVLEEILGSVAVPIGARRSIP